MLDLVTKAESLNESPGSQGTLAVLGSAGLMRACIAFFFFCTKMYSRSSDENVKLSICEAF